MPIINQISSHNVDDENTKKVADEQKGDENVGETAYQSINTLMSS